VVDEPEQIKAHASTAAKPPADKDALRRANVARARENLPGRDSVDQERAFHWAHFQDPRP
jgi:hypothetical protein